MRKVVLLILLLAVLSGVVYLKSVRQSAAETSAFSRGKAEVSKQGQEDHRAADSLSKELTSYRSAIEDSLRIRDSLQWTASDSLSQVIAQQSDSISALEQYISGNPNAKRIAAQAKEDDSTLVLKHRDVLEYYTQRFRDLPPDLSAYEKRVATSEIRTETIKKFAISEDELNEIRKNAKLDF